MQTTTTTDHPNAQIVRDGLDAFSRGDIQAYAETVADDIVWHQIGAPTLHGKQEMAQSMPDGDTGWKIDAKLHDVVANDEHAIALVDVHATRPDGKTLDYRTSEIMHMKDGKVTERWAFADDTKAIIDFFG